MPGSLQDIYNALQTLNQSINAATTAVPRSGGNFTPINNLSSAGFVQVIAPNPKRNNISFHNPGVSTVIVAPLTVGSSQGKFTPTAALLGGTFEILPADWVTLTGLCQQGFQAMVTAGSSQPLTILDQ
jgi:hypothetical protein